jgi:hypothetical protein
VKNNLIEHRDNGSKLIVTSIQKILKYILRFFNPMENHILEGTFPNIIPRFTPRDANPKYQGANLKNQIASMIVNIGSDQVLAILGKSKPDASPAGTLAR